MFISNVSMFKRHICQLSKFNELDNAYNIVRPVRLNSSMVLVHVSQLVFIYLCSYPLHQLSLAVVQA